MFTFLSGATVFILLLAVSDAQYYDFTLAPEYDDYNATFEYSLFSNGSNEDLDLLSKRFVDPAEDTEEDPGGQPEDWDQGVTMTPVAPVTTERGGARSRVTTTTERDEVERHNAASLPVSPEITALCWTLLILIGLNMQQLPHTL